MRKKLFLLPVMLFCIVIIFPLSSFASESIVIENDETGIPDKGLYRGILEALGKQGNEKFTMQEAEAITDLDIVNRQKDPFDVRSLKGIGYLKQLQSLRLEGQKIKSLEGVEELSGLVSLDVTWNQITDLKPIENLQNLKYLSVTDNRLTSVKQIGNLINLKSLYLEFNNLSSLKGIEQLTNLEYLDVSENKLKSLKEVQNLKKLKVLKICHNRIKKLPDLTKFKKLKYGASDFTQNHLTEKELQKKLPARFFEKGAKRKNIWLNQQFNFQNIKYNVKFTTPNSKNKITKKVRKIVGRTQKGTYVQLCNTQKPKLNTELVEVNEKGIFVLDNLSLKKWVGDAAELKVYLDYANNGFKVIKSIKFTVEK